MSSPARGGSRLAQEKKLLGERAPQGKKKDRRGALGEKKKNRGCKKGALPKAKGVKSEKKGYKIGAERKNRRKR